MHTRNRPLVLSTILLLSGTIFHSTASAQAVRGIWQDEKETAVMSARKTPASKRTLVPQVYRTLSVDRAALGAVLATAKPEFSPGDQAPTELVLPMPDGTSARFKVEESPIMDPKLAAEFPEIKTYIGQGIDDPRLTARLDQTPQGFHAIIFTGSGSVYIDPYWRDDATKYISYRRSDFSDPAKIHKCLVQGADKDPAGEAQRPATAARPTGASLRTYRMAVACTGEYAAFHGGTVSLAQAAIVTSINRVNAVYEKDFAIRLQLVANNSSIVFINASTDGFTNSDAGLLIDESQVKIDTLIGNANYDIGHTFSTGAGGLAGLGVVGRAGQKGSGVTGTSNPIGDPYDIDYVAHEVGHQFGGNHTFNGTTAGGNRNASTAYEPGSGSTIMAYAGIMAPEDLQNNSDDYFHSASYSEIDTYTSGASPGNCGVPTATGNTPPTIGALASFTIPNQTPFSLTASATDPNGTDVLTYCWEEFDKGAAKDPAAAPRDNGASPLFRSFNPTTSPVRTFPSRTYILNNSNVPPAKLGSLASGEFLPTTNRTMNFRVTARDNRVGGGGSNYASTTVTSTTSSGPFAITSFNTASTITGGSLQTINWAVANSTAAPVSCANVKISLSTDGGLTYPHILAASTPNDGSASVTIANIATIQGRFKVEAVGNIFFDLSDANTTITNTGTFIGFVEQFETGLTAFADTNHASPGAVIPLATGDWYGLNLSAPIGQTGVFAGENLIFPPDASGLANFAAMDFQNGSGLSQISTFLMSPTKTFNNGDTISFLTRTVTNNDGFADRLRLLFSASGASTNAADFSTTLLSVNEGLTLTDYPNTWTLFTATISGLSGPTSGRFAFNYNVPDSGPDGINGSYIGIDKVTYGTTVTPAPEIEVKNPTGGDLTDGTASVGFGSVLVQKTLTKTITIKNTGTGPLDNLVVTLNGTNAADFTVTQPLLTSILDGASTTFTVTLKPTALGLRNASLHIASNDADESPFDIMLTGTGIAPEIEVRGPKGGRLADGISIFNFGSRVVNFEGTKTFTINNLGDAPLKNLVISKNGSNAPKFTVSQPLLSEIPAGGTTTFTVTFKPTAAGKQGATIHITNNDSNENPFDLTLFGTGLAPEIVVKNPSGTNLVDGKSIVSLGSTVVNTSVTQTFEILNVGEATLKNLLIRKNDLNATDFTFTQPLLRTLAFKASTTFTVTFKPSAINKRVAAIQITNNDSNENPFDLTLSGTGLSKSTIPSDSLTEAGLAELLGLDTSGHSAAETKGLSTSTSVERVDGEKYLVLEVKKPSDGTKFTSHVEVSSDLLDWYSGSNHTTVIEDNKEFLKVQDNTPVSPENKRYIRLK